MIESAPDNDVLEKCTKDILSLIKPEEDDRSKRQSAIQELEISIQSVASLSGAAIKPFGSFLSNLYSKSGDLDLSVQLINSSNDPISKKKKQTILRELRKALQKNGTFFYLFHNLSVQLINSSNDPISKKKKQTILRELRKALQKNDVARYMEFIPHARVPVLQYVSNRFGISCDLSVDNYPGRIKSRVFYWISTLDERFGDMVLLIKEWAKAQNINDPKNGTLNSYSLCLLVLFHFQTCEPAILPPLKDIYEGNITEDFADMALYDEEHLDEVCAANIAKFESQNKEKRNESSLCHLLATFFNKFCHIEALSSDVISTYTGMLEKIEDNPNRRMKKSYSLFVEDPVERLDNAARAVRIKGLLLIASALKDANLKFASLEHSDRDDLLAMLCTPAVCSKLGGRVIANSYASTPQRTHQHTRAIGHAGAKVSNQRQRRQGAKGFTGSRPVHNPPQVSTDNNITGRQTPGQYRNHDPPQVHTDNTTGRQTPGQSRHHDRPQVHTDNTTGRQTPGQYRPQVHTDNTTGRQTPGQYWNHDPPQFHTNTTGHHYQPPRQPVQYQNHYHTSAYTPGHQTAGLYRSPSHLQGYDAWTQSGVPYQNHYHQDVYNPGHQAAWQYQYPSQPPLNISGAQTPGPFQYQRQPQAHATGAQTSGPHQNGYHNQQQMHNAGTGVYQNQGARQYTPRHTNANNRNGVTASSRYQPVAAGLQNVPARDSR